VNDPLEVRLHQGSSVKITLVDTDGEFLVSYGGSIENALTVDADLPDSSGRGGTIYREDYGDSPDAAATAGPLDLGDDCQITFEDEAPARKPYSVVQPDRHEIEYPAGAEAKNYTTLTLMKKIGTEPVIWKVDGHYGATDLTKVVENVKMLHPHWWRIDVFEGELTTVAELNGREPIKRVKR
jgi:hypothetical protein